MAAAPGCRVVASATATAVSGDACEMVRGEVTRRRARDAVERGVVRGWSPRLLAEGTQRAVEGGRERTGGLHDEYRVTRLPRRCAVRVGIVMASGGGDPPLVCVRGWLGTRLPPPPPPTKSWGYSRLCTVYK